MQKLSYLTLGFLNWESRFFNQPSVKPLFLKRVTKSNLIKVPSSSSDRISRCQWNSFRIIKRQQTVKQNGVNNSNYTSWLDYYYFIIYSSCQDWKKQTSLYTFLQLIHYSTNFSSNIVNLSTRNQQLVPQKSLSCLLLDFCRNYPLSLAYKTCSYWKLCAIR